MSSATRAFKGQTEGLAESSVAGRQPGPQPADAKREMRPARIISLLSVTLAAAAAVGPPAAAASGEGGGGAVAGGTLAPSGGGGASYGAPVPKAKAETPKPRRAKRRRCHRPGASRGLKERL